MTLWKWFFDKEKKEITKKNTLFGFDLDKFDYLGRNQVQFINADKKKDVIRKMDVHFFRNKEDQSRHVHYEYYPYSEFAKKYEIERFENHPYVKIHIPLWIAGIESLPSLINEPSPFLNEYMAINYNAKWDSKTTWWIDKDSKEEIETKEVDGKV